jgi:hypothetical protein
MIAIQFDKSRAEHFLDALAHGKPITPGDGRGWTQFDMLMLAGACHFAALSHGPMAFHYHGVPASAEHREADWNTFQGDLLGVINFYSQLTTAVKDGKYDADFEPQVRGILRCKIDGIEIEVSPAAGFKHQGKKE